MSETKRIAEPGKLLTIEFLNNFGETETVNVTIVPDQASDYTSGLLGLNTILAQTLLGQIEGVRLAYKRGDLVAVTIIKIQPTETSHLEDESTMRRMRENQRIHREIAQTNAANFASSFNGKWGDYDPQGMENWEEK